MEIIQKEASKLIRETYAEQGIQNLISKQRILIQLLNQGKLPPDGLSDREIENLVEQLSLMDSNNFTNNAGVGEREGRIFSNIVARRHFYLSHGIGRSGDILEQQPKAAGSSIIYKLTNKMVKHALEIAGFTSLKHCLVLPMATGMSISLTLLALKSQRPLCKYVIWPRIDQKSCFKGILLAGLVPLVVENCWNGDEMSTNLEGIESLLVEYGAAVLCVLSTTSCFAPRQPDKIDEIGRICKKFDVPQVINNAYGIQCPTIAKLMNRACTIGRVDAVIQSTDKNFLVPVGGAIVASPSSSIITAISSIYPGRASMTPILDVFITLLSMGISGYRRLLHERIRLRELLVSQLATFCEANQGRLLSSPRNTISLAITISSIENSPNQCSYLGSMLFRRNISGCRIVPINDKVTTIAGYEFMNWGSHYSNFPASYLTVASAIGLSEKEIDIFMTRLDAAKRKFDKVTLTTTLS